MEPVEIIQPQQILDTSQPVSTTQDGYPAEKFEWIESPIKEIKLEKVAQIDDSLADYQIVSPQDMSEVEFKEMKEFPDTVKTGRPGRVKEIDLRKL